MEKLKYSQVLKDLKSCTDLKAVYFKLREYKRLYDLTYNQAEYLLYQYNNA